LFPGYIFVSLDDEMHRWRPIMSTIGDRTIVRRGDEPGLLDDAFIASPKAREIDGTVSRPGAPLEVGQSVKFSDGPFDGVIAKIVALREQDRIVVLMDQLSGIGEGHGAGRGTIPRPLESRTG
jgi:transcriptional antiterminator RfaH